MKKFFFGVFVVCLNLLFLSVCQADEVKVHVTFRENITVNGQVVPFCDALVMSLSEYDALTPESLAAKKKERVDNWKYMLEHPAPYVPPTPEQLQAELEGIKQNEQSVSDRKKEILVALGSTELEAEQTEMRDIETKFNSVKEKVDALSPEVEPLEAVAVILDNQKKDVDERIAKKGEQ